MSELNYPKTIIKILKKLNTILPRKNKYKNSESAFALGLLYFIMSNQMDLTIFRGLLAGCGLFWIIIGFTRNFNSN